ncbi:MAG TPA: tetratricopeptide repeat protein [Oligoflexia bacterium]|nr:tetratricopeptide repeat protein [Oligoflexia bacterium]
MTFRSWVAYGRAHSYLEQKNHEEAIAAYGEAIRWYAPLNPWNVWAVNEMYTLAENFEKQGLIGPAKNTYVELRSSLSSVRGAYFPMYFVVIKSTKQYLEVLIDELKMLPSQSLNFETLKQKYSLSKRGYKPALLSIVFIVWLISLTLWIMRAFDKNGRMYANKIIYSWGLSNVIFMGWWLCMLTYL